MTLSRTSLVWNAIQHSPFTYYYSERPTVCGLFWRFIGALLFWIVATTFIGILIGMFGVAIWTAPFMTLGTIAGLLALISGIVFGATGVGKVYTAAKTKGWCPYVEII